MTRAARFSQADLTRAVRACEKAGLCVAGVEIGPTGTIRVLTVAAETNDDWRKGSPLYRDEAA
jgi:hypothetical protein